jgi:adenine-specific DNA-methyltransferase
VQDCLKFWADESALVLDFFAGSGTTAHAVINLNREDDGNRKYILVEQGAYFDTVLKPRIQKVIYARDWKDGKPVEGSQGSSHCFQYVRLESYEDTLDNLDLKGPAAPVPTLFAEDHDDYLLKYMLDHETRETRLNVAAFTTPFDYKLRVRRNGVETQVGVDLVETANYLLGLGVTARRALSHQGRTYRVIEGTVGDDLIIVVWRNTEKLDLQKEAAFVQEKILADRAVDRIYINGDSHVPNATPIETVSVNAMR